MIYKSDREFRLWISTVSHGRVVIRSEMQYSDVDYKSPYLDRADENIDLEFGDTVYINIPTTLKGVEIQEIRPSEDLKKFVKHNNRVYQIDSEGESYFIIAYRMIVGSNKSDCDRISDMSMNHDEILAEG